MSEAKKKVLIVDDETDIVEVLQMRVESAGYEAITALSGEDALKLISAGLPDLIILDVMMPGIDGYQLFKAIKKYPGTARIPVIMLTARGNMRETFESLDADAFIAKPYDAAELMSKVRFLIENKVLVLINNDYAEEQIAAALKENGCTPHFVKTEAALVNAAHENKFDKVLYHLALVTLKPDELLSTVSDFRYKNPLVMLYSDSSVKGLEDDYQVAIDKLRLEWKGAGVDCFYDSREAVSPFTDAFRIWILANEK